MRSQNTVSAKSKLSQFQFLFESPQQVCIKKCFSVATLIWYHYPTILSWCHNIIIVVVRATNFWPKYLKFWLNNLQIFTLFWPINFLFLQLNSRIKSMCTRNQTDRWKSLFCWNDKKIKCERSNKARSNKAYRRKAIQKHKRNIQCQ